MILSTLKDSARVEYLHPSFKEVFDFFKNNNVEALLEKRIVLDGDNLFINNDTVKGLKKENQILEIHRKYIDIHYLISGSETIGWSPLDCISKIKVPYQEDKDFAFYLDIPQCYVTLKPGDIFIAYPEDAHGPIIGEGEIHKLIAKIKL